MTDIKIPETNWKKNLVLIAKNTFVWMYQLSKEYGRNINSIDQIPMEEFEKFASLGINGIWLIGIWERSVASRMIKNLYGYDHAAASAYSILEYKITKNIGGRESYLRFREKADKFGIKIGCDMVPNHTGLDSPWLLEHPDWYIQADVNPSENFTFNSPNLLSHEDIEIRIEEGYYTQTGASEVFLYRNKKTAEEKFIYHGNDGTSMPWNDTAQLNYLNPQVRDEVRKTIADVAVDFDVIRLDAAMTLTRRHFKRLWYPGEDGERCIPTREIYRMSSTEFDQLMPNEFWKQVVDDVKTHQTDTLLIAEAFWLMEGYFIKHLGMDRVYNSAFMNMIRDEENKKFKNCLRDMASISPNALGHLVNYQTTPDEESAINQFGNGDKYFSVGTVLCTLPGLPMFGHGQLLGYRERYGMDYLMPHMQESPDMLLFNKHKKIIAPLLQKRQLFSSCENFKIIELHDADGQVVDDIIAFTNEYNGERGLVIFNNSPIALKGRADSQMLMPNKKLSQLMNLDKDLVGHVSFSFMKDSEEIKFKLSPYASEVFLLL